MTVSANTAYQMSQTALNQGSTEQVNTELALVNTRITNATTYGLTSVSYAATLVGNPPGDPSVDASLTQNQLAFRNSLLGIGYIVGIDTLTGNWAISWAQQGPEEQVRVYEIHTTVVPGPVGNSTVTALETFFAGLNPVGTVRVYIGGSAIESTYVHLCVAHQQNLTDLSTDILGALTGAGLGYSGGNTSVYLRT